MTRLASLFASIVSPSPALVLAGIATACCTPEPNESALRRVPFRVVSAHHAPADELRIDDVSSDRASLVPGATLRVRGCCVLASRPRGLLYLGLTNGKVAEERTLAVQAGETAFDLVVRVVRTGEGHVSIYDPSIESGDNAFGTCRFVLVGR